MRYINRLFTYLLLLTYRMHRVCVAIWETGEWPEEWTFSTFIPLPKKGDLKQCAHYRTIALVSHVGAKLQATNRVPRPVDRGTATRYGG